MRKRWWILEASCDPTAPLPHRLLRSREAETKKFVSIGDKRIYGHASVVKELNIWWLANDGDLPMRMEEEFLSGKFFDTQERLL